MSSQILSGAGTQAVPGAAVSHLGMLPMSSRREEILAAACDLYLRSGFRGFSMRHLAAEVGISAPALYRYYQGRNALLTEVVREAHRVFFSYVHHALEGATPLERLRGAGRAYLDFAIEQPGWYSIMFAAPEHFGSDAFPDIDAMAHAVQQFWIDRVGECMRDGILIGDDPQAVSATLWGCAHGMVDLWQQGRLGPVDPETFREMSLRSGERLLRGLATPRSAAGV